MTEPVEDSDYSKRPSALPLVGLNVIGRRPRVVDFCSGGGHLAILLAHLMPEADVYLVENKEDSLRRAAARIRELGELGPVVR